MALPAPTEDALATPRFAFRHSKIPRPASCSLKKEPDDLSPKSVIVNRRVVSPASSSSSSSMDRRNTLLEATHLKPQPRHDRGYSISDGEFSDPDSCMDSSGTSLELGKAGNPGSLEPLPEAHSLALEATTSSNAALAEKTSHAGNGLESAEVAAMSIFAARASSDFGRGEHDTSETSVQLLQIPISGSDGMRSSIRGLQMPGLQRVVDDEKGGIRECSEWSQTSTSSGSASEQEGKEEEEDDPSTTSFTLESAIRSRRRDQHSARPATFSAELLSTSGNQLERGDDTSKRARPVAVGQGAANNFGYPGTPLLRYSPSWSSQAGTPPSSTTTTTTTTTFAFSSASPRVEKGFGAYSPASSTDLPTGLRYQHRFLSGPIMGSMIPKPPPSKWDDAEKWIVSPGHSDQSPAQPHRRAGPTLLTGRRNSIAGVPSQRYSFGADSPDYATPPGEKPMSPQFENAFINAGKIESPVNTSVAVKNKHSKALSFGDLSRRFDASRAAVAGNLPPAQQQQPHHATVPFREGNDQKAETVSESMNTQNTGDGPSEESRVPKHARSASMKEISTPVVVAKVCLPEPTTCRDMGTQMTPAESLRNSTCTTPGLTTSPTRHNTPARSGQRAASLGAFPGAVETLELQNCHLAKLELRKLAGDGHQPTMDRNSVWTTREEEDLESAASLRGDSEDLGRCKNAARATAWEEAEQAKALFRCKNKEAKIQAWEELQQAKAEAEMKKIEAKVERTLVDANEKMRGRVAKAAKKAAEMRAAAALVRSEQAAKAADRAHLIRQTGLLSPARSSLTSCFLV